MKPQGLRSAAGFSLRVVRSVRLVAQIGQQVSETGFLVVENLAVNVLLGTTFIGDNVESISPGKQMVHPIRSSPVALLGMDQHESLVAHVSEQPEEPVGFEAAKMTVIPAATQATVVVRVPAARLYMVETHQHLMRRRVAMVARSVCKAVPNCLFTIFVANWSNSRITLPKNMLVAQCT